MSAPILTATGAPSAWRQVANVLASLRIALVPMLVADKLLVNLRRRANPA